MNSNAQLHSLLSCACERAGLSVLMLLALLPGLHTLQPTMRSQQLLWLFVKQLQAAVPCNNSMVSSAVDLPTTAGPLLGSVRTIRPATEWTPPAQ
jgi:hypothetical protein